MKTADGTSSLKEPSVTRYRQVSATARLARWVAAIALIAAIGVVLYAGWLMGYGYLQAKAGQEELHSLFSVSGNGSVESGYLVREAEGLRSRLTALDPVGEITIPAIGADSMIVEGTDKDALSRGPGHIVETPLPGMGGNFVVAGDRVLYGAPFLKLNDLSAGDRIQVKMPYATFFYRVRESFIITPDDVSVLQPVGYEAITLLTCDPPWDVTRRIVIRGELERVLPAGSEM